MRNMLLHQKAADITWRVLDEVASSETEDLEPTHVVVIAMGADKVMPVLWGKGKVLESIADRDLMVVEETREPIHDESLSPADRALLERRWQLVKSVLPHGVKLYDAHFRGTLAVELEKSKIASKPFFYGTLRSFWQGGGGKWSLMPGFARCGQPGVPRIAENAADKKGRPRTIRPGNGVAITESHLRNMRRAWARSPVGTDGKGLRGAFSWMLTTVYWRHVSVKPGKTQLVVVTDIDAVPTFEQFQYHWNKEYSYADRLLKRFKQRGFDLLTKLLLSGTLKELDGPGIRYYIDATVMDVYIVSRLDPNKILGRPTLYLVVDQFSRMIVGMYIGLEPPCWEGAMLAVWNACLDKVAFCAQYGITIPANLWPTGHIPTHLMGDRGELISHQAERLISGFNLDVENSRPYSGEAKGVVERCFGTLQTKFGPYMPGYVEKKPEKGTEHASLKAALNLDEVTRCVINGVLWMNTRVVREYGGAVEIVASKTPFVPVELWKWGVENLRCGYRPFSAEYVQAHLWPESTMKLSRKALHFQRGLYYMSPEVASQTWFAKALVQHQKLSVIYHPSNVGVAYVRNITGNSGLLPITLTKRTDRFQGMSLSEIVGLSKAAGENNAVAERDMAPMRAGWELENAEMAKQAKRNATQLRDPGLSDAGRRKGIRQNKQDELAAMTSEALLGSAGYDATGRLIEGEAREVTAGDASVRTNEFSHLLEAGLRNAGFIDD